ncbi:MAG TPA: hypothetical protein VFM73_09995 [Xanthomonadaceae bacterium]|nr:hypothetical protein [Xanthomonadaceae bacterium]
MDRRTRPVMLAAVPLLFAMSGSAGAETLLVQRVQAEPAAALPDRGLSMSQVQARYGEPVARLDPRGGQKSQWPVIHRWTYPAFTVYFERDTVIDAVANRASAAETGPLPPVR